MLKIGFDQQPLQLKACEHSCFLICSKPKKGETIQQKVCKLYIYMKILRHCDKWSGCLFSPQLQDYHLATGRPYHFLPTFDGLSCR